MLGPHRTCELWSGALLLKASRDLTFRQAEDLIRHYAPARYLCGLTETEWRPDHNTLHDFEALLGEEGFRLINEYVVKLALKERLTFSSLAVGDTTAQEAAIPYPNEMKLMAAFMSSVAATALRAGKKLKDFVCATSDKFQAAKETMREFRLFAKTKTKEQKLRIMARMMGHVRSIQNNLARTLEGLKPRVQGYGKVAFARVQKLHEVMNRLLPQIQYWHRTGWVAANKIISLTMPKLYSIPRGKVGKSLEFGLSWGITRLKGGFVLAHVAANKRELVDIRVIGYWSVFQGLGLGLLYQATDNLLVPMVSHGLFDMGAMLYFRWFMGASPARTQGSV